MGPGYCPVEMAEYQPVLFSVLECKNDEKQICFVFYEDASFFLFFPLCEISETEVLLGFYLSFFPIKKKNKHFELEKKIKKE